MFPAVRGQSLQVGGGKRLRDEGGFAVVVRERPVQFRRAAGEHDGVAQVFADDFRGFLHGQTLQGAGRPLVEAAHFLQGICPAVRLMGNLFLENGERHRGRSGPQIFHAAGHAGNVFKRTLIGKESADFQVRVDARLRPAKELEHQSLTVFDKGVAGGRRRENGRRGFFDPPAHLGEGGGLEGADASHIGGQFLLARDRFQPEGTDGFLRKGIVNNRLAVLLRYRDRSEIEFRLAVSKFDLYERQDRRDAVGRERRPVNDAYGLETARLAAKPALRLQERREGGFDLRRVGVHPLPYPQALHMK